MKKLLLLIILFPTLCFADGKVLQWPVASAPTSTTLYINGSQTTGQAADISNGVGTVTVTPDATNTTGTIAPTTNGAFSIPTTGDYVSVAADDNVDMESGSLTFYYKQSGTAPAAYNFFVLGGTQTDFQFFWAGSDYKFYINGTFTSWFTTEQTADSWQKYEFSWDQAEGAATAIKFWIDDVLQSKNQNATFTAPTISSRTLYIGNGSGGGGWIAGDIDDIKFTNDPADVL